MTYKVGNDQLFELPTRKKHSWDYDTARNRCVNVAPTLRPAMTKNRNLMATS